MFIPRNAAFGKLKPNLTCPRPALCYNPSVELTFLEVASQGILTAMKLAVPILGLSLAAGFLISIFQAVTSIQEQTLTFVP